jgi:hypothetical protein
MGSMTHAAGVSGPTHPLLVHLVSRSCAADEQFAPRDWLAARVLLLPDSVVDVERIRVWVLAVEQSRRGA